MKFALKASALALSAACLLPSPASASLVFDNSVQFSAQGFGNAPRDLTFQGSGTTSGCVGVAAGGSITFGNSSCISNAQVFGSNGVQNAGGFEVNPLSDNQKYGIPTISELGWLSAADVGVLYNATQPGGAGTNITDITLKFYNPTTGVLIKAIDGQQNLSSTFAGNGSAGFTFVVDAAQRTELQNTVFNQAGFGNFRIALESTIAGASAGPESFTIVNLRSPNAPLPEPATWLMMVLGFGGIGLAMRKRNRASLARVHFA